MKRNIVVIGLGPHAQACQYRFLEELRQSGTPVRVRLLVELQDRQADVEQFLQNKALQPDQIFGLPVDDRNNATIHPQLLQHLEKIKHTIDGILICTEPKAHKKYILWALENNIDVLTDKPLTAPLINEQGFYQVYQDFLDIEDALKKSSARLCLLTNKRVHDAFGGVYQQVREFVTTYKMPLTHIEISEGGGDFFFPSEFETRENHPFKYGYGVLLHTGFHFVDLLLHYQSVNHLIGLQEDEIKLHAFATTPFDVAHQLTQPVYEKLFPNENFTEEFQKIPLENYKKYGEVDVVSSLQFVKDGAVITQGSLNMLKNTLSARAWRPLPSDPYKKNGRLSQNYISLFCGPLFNVRLSYFQPDKIPQGTFDKYIVEVQRNTALVGGESYLVQEFEDKTTTATGSLGSRNLAAKFAILAAWMYDTCEQTDFALHKRSVYLTSRLFEEIFSRRQERFSTSN